MIRAAVLSIVLSLSLAVHASVPPMVSEVAREYGIPDQIFYAVILAESRSATKAGAKAWPWTINHRGHPHFFHTQVDAYAYANLLVEQGDYSFDLGIAQMNWRWHRDKFDYNLWQALDPRTNLRAAAQHLREQYDRPECGQWEVAVGCYHRPARGKQDLEIAQSYADRVMKIWWTL